MAIDRSGNGEGKEGPGADVRPEQGPETDGSVATAPAPAKEPAAAPGNGSAEPVKNGAKDAGGQEKQPEPDSPHPYEELLDEYPIREPGEDPVWSVRIVKGWMWFLAFATGGIVLLLILGLFFD